MELMVTIAILAVMTAIAIPNFISWFPQYRLNVAAREMISTIQMARLKAIRGNTDIIMFINMGANTVTVFQDDGAGSVLGADGIPVNARNWTLDGTERTFRTEPLPPGIDITGAAFPLVSIVRFNQRGFPVDAAGNSTQGRITLDNGRGGSNSEIEIQVDISGNARML